MEVIKEWAQSVIIAALIAAIVGAAAPAGSFEKPMKTIVGLFMLVAFASPLVSLQPSAIQNSVGMNELIETHELEKQVEKQVREKLEEEICNSVTAYITGKGAKVSEVDSRVRIDRENNIEVSSISITFSEKISDALIGDITEYVALNFGAEPTITVDDGEEYEAGN